MNTPLNGETRCQAHVDVDLVRDDIEGPIPHAFPCIKESGHAGLHLAHVDWSDGDDD